MDKDEIFNDILNKYSTSPTYIEVKNIEENAGLLELIKSNQNLKNFAIELHLFNKRTREKVNMLKSKLKFEDCLNGMLIYYYNMCLINFNYFQKMNLNFIACKRYSDKLVDCLTKIRSFNLKLDQENLKIIQDLDNLCKVIEKHYEKKSSKTENLKSLIELGDLDKIGKLAENIDQEIMAKVSSIKLINMLNQNENELTLRTSQMDLVEISFNLYTIFKLIEHENVSKSYIEYAKCIHVKKAKK